MPKTKEEFLTGLDQLYKDEFGCEPNAHRQENYRQIVDTLENAINNYLSKIQILYTSTTPWIFPFSPITGT